MATIAAVPERTITQRLDALATANRIRSQRAALKRDIHAGRRRACQVLADPPEWVGTMKVVELLLAIPKCGRVNAAHFLRVTEISPVKTLGGLSSRQRQDLLRRLHGR